MKEPEMLQTIVMHHCLSYEIVFQVIQKKPKNVHTHTHNSGKIWRNVVFLFKKLLKS